MLSPTRGLMVTSSGFVFDPADPDGSPVPSPRELVRALARLNRWGGYFEGARCSVARHSMVVSGALFRSRLLLDPAAEVLALLESCLGLVHDLREAILAELPTPLKAICPGYVELEERWHCALLRMLGIPLERSDEVLRVAEFDRLVLNAEDRLLRGEGREVVELFAGFEVKSEWYRKSAEEDEAHFLTALTAQLPELDPDRPLRE